MSPHDDAAGRASSTSSSLRRRTIVGGALSGALALGAATLPATAASAAPIRGLPGEISRKINVPTQNKRVLYDNLVVSIGGDSARIFIPQSVKPNQTTPVPVIWFIHSAQADHNSLNSVFKYPAELAVEKGAIAICQTLGGTLWTNDTAQGHQRNGYAYLSGLFPIRASYMWSLSAGGALACENYGSKVIPGINGLYLVNGVYDLRDIHDRSLRGRISIGDAFGSTAQIDAHNPKRLPSSAWAGTNIRVVVSDADHVDTSVPPTLHGLALVAKAKSTAKEASVRYHTLGHNPPSWANQDGIDAIFRWHAALGTTTPPTTTPVAVPAPVARWDFAQTSGPFTASNGAFPLSQIGSTAAATIATPFGRGLALKGSSALAVPKASVGALNRGAGSGKVTVAAWVRQNDPNTGCVAGVWSDSAGAAGRSYGLFYDVSSYGGADRACFYVSRSGGATPGYPYPRDYSATKTLMTPGVWQLHVGTYDGAVATSYLNGVASAYPSFTDSTGATYARNPYPFSSGLNPLPADFTVGASRTGGVLGNFAIADVARLRVWDVALTAAQVKAIYTQESALL
ncbi:LamG domain-containing protein [Rathayibacter sp. Leaf248]|uniref:LamG domain-containing protein n=1 Tax=Rathayibacter sp. Leaf248 TaxID=2876555 RepID=UPI001E4B091A|nr:LamG domain-containing protein [Rathayibacter sp. Leaf248]